MLPVDNKNEEPLIHLENKAKSHENLEQTKHAKKTRFLVKKKI